jgi:outer membrane autotransporter protein
LPSLDAVRASYDQLAGQNRPPLAPIVASDTAKFMGIISNRLQGARGTVAKSLKDLSDMPLLAMARPDSLLGTGSTSDLTWDGFLWSVGRDTPEMTNEDWGAWAKLYGIFGDRKTDNGFPGYSYDVTGETFGIDVDLSDWMVGGFTGGTSKGDVEYDGLDDTADVRNTHFGLYSSISADGWYLNSIVTYSRIDIHTERPVDLTGETYTADFDGREMSGYAEVGFDWQPRSTWLIQPLVAMQVTFLHLDQYAENGYAGALVFEDQDYDSYKAALGVKATKELTLGRQGPPAIVQVRGRGRASDLVDRQRCGGLPRQHCGRGRAWHPPESRVPSVRRLRQDLQLRQDRQRHQRRRGIPLVSRKLNEQSWNSALPE